MRGVGEGDTYASLLDRKLSLLNGKKVIFIQSVHTLITYSTYLHIFLLQLIFSLRASWFNLEAVSQNTEFTVQYELCAPVSTLSIQVAFATSHCYEPGTLPRR